MLPIWIVKQIFSYLDQKTLKKVHAVNPYWAYVTDDLAKERACRKRMDKIIEKMEVKDDGHIYFDLPDLTNFLNSLNLLLYRRRLIAHEYRMRTRNE